MFTYISHKNIDKAKWNYTIDNAVNGMPYGYSWYLDTVSPNWDALVSEDYKMIFPVTWRKKYGIKYLFQPLFLRYFNIYSLEKSPDSAIVNEVLSMLMEKFNFIEINLNEKIENPPAGIQTGKLMAQKIDMLKPIPLPSHSLKQNLSKAKKAGLYGYSDMPSGEFVECVGKELGKKIQELGTEEYRILKKLIDRSSSESKGIVLGIPDTQGQFYCGCYLVISHGYTITIQTFSSADGRKNGAMSFLRFNYIKSLEGKPLVVDFAGSNLPGVAEYNHYFGAEDYFYHSIKYNALPWPLRIFKK